MGIEIGVVPGLRRGHAAGMDHQRRLGEGRVVRPGKGQLLGRLVQLCNEVLPHHDPAQRRQRKVFAVDAGVTVRAGLHDFHRVDASGGRQRDQPGQDLSRSLGQCDGPSWGVFRQDAGRGSIQRQRDAGRRDAGTHQPERRGQCHGAGAVNAHRQTVVGGGRQQPVQFFQTGRRADVEPLPPMMVAQGPARRDGLLQPGAQWGTRAVGNVPEHGGREDTDAGVGEGVGFRVCGGLRVVPRACLVCRAGQFQVAVVQREVPASVVSGVVHHQAPAVAFAGSQTLRHLGQPCVVQIAPGVAADDRERRVVRFVPGEQRQGACNAAGRFQRLTLGRVGDVHAVGAAIAQGSWNLLTQPGMVDDDLGDAGRRQLFQVPDD